MAYSIYIVDDHPAMRLGMRNFLHQEGFTVMGEAESGEAALNDPALLRCDVVLLDIRMSGMDGLEALPKILELSSRLKVLLYTGHDNPTYQARGIALGAMGVVFKNEPLEKVVNAIGAVCQGSTCWSKDQRRRATTGSKRMKTTLPVSDIALTQRELDVLIQLANGLTNKEIASTLGIGYETVKEHVQHVLRKLGVTDRTQAAVWAVRQNVV